MNAIIILADGFEEIEAVAVIDILRRAGVDLTVAGLEKADVVSARQLHVRADVVFSSVINQTFSAVILPGGEPGTTNLQKSTLLAEFLTRHVQHNALIAAICAAPRILANLGFLKAICATSFPAIKPEMKDCFYREEPVVVARNFITSRGAGTSMEFAFAILDYLGLAEKSAKLKQAMLCSIYK